MDMTGQEDTGKMTGAEDTGRRTGADNTGKTAGRTKAGKQEERAARSANQTDRRMASGDAVRQPQQVQGTVRRQPEQIDLKELFFMLLARWRMILLATLAGAALLGAYSTFFLSPSYQTTASIYITSTDSVISISDLQLSAALTEDYAKIIKSRTTLNKVIDELGLDLNYKGLGNLVSVSNPDSTHIVEITVTCSDPELCRDIANALVDIGVNQIYQVIGSNMPTVIDFSAAESVEEIKDSLASWLAKGGMLGCVLVCAILVLRFLLDTTLKTEEDMEKYLGLPVLSSIPYYQEL
ncbi:MAG: Wzz/FepE/Etk N-terminal domain-containing protein [Lachnospiraceae bacterium]|nr:Wzz/FepE/Etk N-terminal domain-containing protein [Lachnospiraceae bacterium]